MDETLKCGQCERWQFPSTFKGLGRCTKIKEKADSPYLSHSEPKPLHTGAKVGCVFDEEA